MANDRCEVCGEPTDKWGHLCNECLGSLSYRACAPIGVGSRVELRAHTDWWMRGARYGMVTRILSRGPRKGCYRVSLEVGGEPIGKLAVLRPCDVLAIVVP